MKIVDTKTLKVLIADARQERRNRQAPPGLAGRLHPDGKHVLNDGIMVDDGATIRSYVMANTGDPVNPTPFWLDLAVENYNAIPNFDPEAKKP